MPVQTLPSAVARAVEGTIAEAEVVVTPTGVVFELEVGDTEYTVDPMGKILAQAREHDTDKD